VLGLADAAVVRLKLAELRLCRPRQWGGLLAGGEPGGAKLALDRFLGPSGSGPSRKSLAPAKALGGRVGTRCWLLVATLPGCLAPRVTPRGLKAHGLASGACIANGSRAAPWPTCWARMSDWRRSTSSTAVTIGCSEHKQALFDHLVGRWRDTCSTFSFDVLLYDLTKYLFRERSAVSGKRQASARVFA